MDFNEAKVFNIILANIKNNQVKTTHQLRIALENLSESANINTLKLLVSFRAWLLEKNIELSTTDGAVTLGKVK